MGSLRAYLYVFFFPLLNSFYCYCYYFLFAKHLILSAIIFSPTLCESLNQFLIFYLVFNGGNIGYFIPVWVSCSDFNY